MKEKYKGMTVNERLYVSGLIDKFDKCIEQGQVEEVKRILVEVGISEAESIEAILRHYNLEP